MRLERDWSAQQAHEALREGLGLAPKSRAAYVAIEDGRPLRPREEAFLRSYFNGGPTAQDAEPSSMATSGRDDTPSPDVAALIELVGQLLREQAEDRKVIRQLIGLLSPEPPPYDPEEERAEVREREERLARERPETMSRRRRSDPEHRRADSQRVPQEDAG